MFVPHEVPLGLSPVSVQTGAPVAQTFAASLHGFPVTVHAVPPAQEVHAPSLHTMPVPQTMPFGCAVWVSAHDASPVAEHVVCPTWHGLVGRQALPGVHVGASLPPPSTLLDPPVPATDPPVVPATEPPLPVLPPVEPPRPATLPPPTPRGLPPGPPPPVPAVPMPPSGVSGSTRRPHPRLEHPRRTDTNTARFSISSP